METRSGLAWLLMPALLAGLALLCGCTTTAAKKALAKPMVDDTRFDGSPGKESERRTRELEPVSDDMNPEKAVEILVDHMQRQEPAYFIPAEASLRLWATKQGVPGIIVRKVRLLLKNPRIEVRAPALRLVCAFGSRECAGDLIEVLTDPDYGMRKTAFETLRARAGMDLGFQPGGGEAARDQAVLAWRRWWEEDQRALASRQAPSPKFDQPAPPTIVTPEPTEKKAVPGKPLAPEEEKILPPPKDNSG